jgi:hypothetical protein
LHLSDTGGKKYGSAVRVKWLVIDFKKANDSGRRAELFRIVMRLDFTWS